MTRNEPSQWEHNVFVSFTPDKETKAFIKDLFNWLNQVGISYFRVGKEEGVTKDNMAKRKYAISPRRCAIAVVVFSENYLKEPCQSELVEILKSGTDHCLVVIPIYPAGDKKYDKWRSHLVAQNISGYEWSNLTAPCVDAHGYESKPIDIIAERLVREIHSLYSEKVFGPFGNEGVKNWESTSRIHGITVRYRKFIKYIDFNAANPSSERPTTDGGDGEEKTYRVKLKEGEYISSFAGYFEDADEKKIKSLTFRTNKRTLGPIRVEKEDEEEAKKEKENEKYFSIPSKAGKVTKIFWRINNNDFLESIGANVKLHLEEFKPILIAKSFGQDSNQYKNVGKIIFELDSRGKSFIEIQNVEKDGELEKYDSNKAQLVKSYELKSDGQAWRLTSMSKSIGPFGGGDFWDDGKFNGVREIHLAAKDGIRHIKIVYDKGCKNDPESIYGDYPGDSSWKIEEIKLDYPREYLTSISGYKQEDGSILQLTFCSNKKIYDHGKEESGQYFCSPTTGSRIIGFYGTWGKTLESIGVHVEPIPHMRPFKIVRPPPFKGSGETYWDDGVHSNVIAFRVTDVKDSKGRLKIESITFKYDDHGVTFEGDRHGGGTRGKWVELTFPEERLLLIKGTMSEEDGQNIIHDLEIYTSSPNRTVHRYARREKPVPEKSSKTRKGPSEQKEQKDKSVVPKEFSLPEISDSLRRIVGFFGTAGEKHLSSIGARLEPY